MARKTRKEKRQEARRDRVSRRERKWVRTYERQQGRALGVRRFKLPHPDVLMKEHEARDRKRRDREIADIRRRAAA